MHVETCPSDETIAELVCRRLGEPKAEIVEAHIADCAACRQLVGTLAAASLPRLGHGSHVPGDGVETEPVSDHAVANGAQRYVIRRELARGGMGRISIADDTFLGRTVAIKELLVSSPALASRFRRELSLTARLQHPSIVSIHDGGLWPSGEPFYVMRLVSGEPLDRVIARHDSVASRLGLLPRGIAMVEALAYAHSQGIIHRDLKPSNVLVGDFGETIVIDWGLAKDLRRGDDGAAADDVAITGSSEPAAPIETIAGLVVGTPAYMAPEQARGEPIDERADVYALGAVLYHVFAGAPPHRGDKIDDIVRAVRSETPVPLVERAIGIPPDLTAIVHKAMSPRPENRYATARELALELRRFQSGQLVDAHRYSSWHLVKRWIRKHRTAVAVAAVALLVLAAVVVVGFRRVLAEQRRAEGNRADADGLMTFMLTDLHDKLQPIGKLDLLGTVAHKARDYYRANGDEDGTDALHNRVTAMVNLGEVLNAQGDPTGALTEYRDALALAETLATRDPANLTWQHLLSTCHGRAGAVLIDQRDAAGALREFRASLTVDQQVAQREPADAGVHRDLAFDLLEIGDVLEDQDDLDGSLREYREGLAIVTKFSSIAPGDPMWQGLLTRSHGDVGDVLLKRGDRAGALAEDRAALEVAEKLVARDPGNGDWQTRAINQHIHLGAIIEQDDPAAALVHFRAALAASEQLVARDPTNEIWQRAFSMSESQVGEVLMSQGNAADAQKAFRAAVASEQALAAKAPGNQAIQHELLAGEGLLGELLLDGGDTAGALVEFQATLVIAEKIAVRDPTNIGSQRDLATAHNNVASALFEQHANANALAEFRSAVEISTRLAEKDRSNVDVQHELCVETMSVGDALAAQHDATAALAEYRAAMELAAKLLGSQASGQTVDQTAMSTRFDAHTKVGDILDGQGAKSEALVEYRAAVAAADQLAAAFPTLVAFEEALADSRAKLGEALRARHLVTESTAEYRAALAVAEKLAARDPSNASAAKRVRELRATLAASR